MSGRCWAFGHTLVHQADLPSASGFEFDLYGCRRCDYHEMRCYCVASSMGGTEAVTPEEAAIMMSRAPGELKQFMREWHARVIG